MNLTLADSVFLMSVAKPVIVALCLGGWAWVASALDKDAGFYYLKRERFGLVHVATAIVGFGLMLLVPIFWIGLPMGLLVLAGSLTAYVVYRNGQVPEAEKWSASLESLQKKRELKQQEARQRKATLTIMGKGGEPKDLPLPGDEDAERYMRLDEMLGFALPRGANQIDLVVDSTAAKYRVHIDGVRYPQEAADPAEAVKFINFIKGLADMDVEERRKKQKTELDVRQEGQGNYHLHVIAAGSTKGMQMQILIDPERVNNIPVEHLGLLPGQMQAMRKLLDDKGKVVVIAAPPHQGGPTTLYSLLQEHDPYTSSVITLEDEVLFDLEGVDHNIIAPGTPGEKINERLGAILRSDPSVVMVSRVVDPEMARLLAQDAPEIRMYVPVPQEGVFAALQLWMKVAQDHEKVAEGLGAVMAQRLVRRLCHTCRVAYVPDPSALKKLNLPSTKVRELFRASGKIMEKDREVLCPACHGIGYRGRVGVFELMIVDDAARKYIATNQLDTLRLHLRKHKMLYLQEAALAKVVDGTTDIKEVTRVMSTK
ncbi:MAG: ATPase, T2SS/T4P/T4SS family [Algisphaera sp.]